MDSASAPAMRARRPGERDRHATHFHAGSPRRPARRLDGGSIAPKAIHWPPSRVRPSHPGRRRLDRYPQCAGSADPQPPGSQPAIAGAVAGSTTSAERGRTANNPRQDAQEGTWCRQALDVPDRLLVRSTDPRVGPIGRQGTPHDARNRSGFARRAALLRAVQAAGEPGRLSGDWRRMIGRPMVAVTQPRSAGAALRGAEGRPGRRELSSHACPKATLPVSGAACPCRLPPTISTGSGLHQR